MPIYRGSGGAGDSTTDATVTEVTQQAINAANSATQAATSASNAATSANNASTSATAASTSATNAASSASSASTSASNASTSATASASSATSAAASASAAQTAQTAAETAETNAETAETNAESAQAYAEEWATKAEDSLISTAAGGDGSTDYSALHHAAKAATSETNAATSETNASNSATSASNSATASANSATAAATSATSASTSASAAATSATSAASSAASAASALDNFDDRYLGSKTADPALDNDGNALIVGALYFNTTDGVMKVYTASGWIAASSASVATMVKYNFTATNGQTVFSGADDNTETLSLTVGAEIVTLNGVVLEQGTDYTATSSAITLTSGASTSDELNVFAFGNFTVADTVSASAGGTFTGAVDFDGAVAFNSTVTGIATDLVDDTTPQLGGNLDTNGNDITFGDNDKAIFGAGSDLQIYHADTGNSFITESGTGNLVIQATDLRLNSASNSPMIHATASTSVQLHYNGSEKLATTSTGIDVTGTAVTDGLTVAGNVSVDGGTIKLDGNYPVGSNNVALGNTALDDGSLTGNNNTAIGADTLTAATTASANTAVGTNALEANQTGFFNTGIGFDALKVNTAGSNTAVGASALSANTSGSSSVAVGRSALATNETGIQNVAIGASALDASTTASANTAIGEQAMTDNLTGAQNVAVGKNALASNTSASDNTAVGYAALGANETGTNNTAVGHVALDACISGNSNTAVGADALTALTTATVNVAVGQGAGQANQTGGSNTYIGRAAGNAATGEKNTFVGNDCGELITSGSKNTIIGRFNGNSGGLDIRTSSNNIVLSDGDGNPRVRVDSSGNTNIATLDMGTISLASGTDTGHSFSASGYAIHSISGGTPLYCQRLSNDGNLVSFYQGATQEGTISVSGTTVSYNGGHLARWSRLADDSKDTSIVKGTVMTNLDAMVEWGDEDNEQLNKMAVSSVEGDANVAGVFVNWDEDDDWNDMNIAMTGDMVIRIASGTAVARGDLLMSAGDGTAKPQGDDIVRSKTIAKVTSTHVSHTYDDGSYLVPCVLMAC